MIDIIYIITAVIFFVACLFYARLCGRL